MIENLIIAFIEVVKIFLNPMVLPFTILGILSYITKRRKHS